MQLKEIMEFKNFCVIGDTLNIEKYAYKIKQELINHNYEVTCIKEDYISLNEVPNLEVIDLCINPIKGLMLLKECTKDYKVVLIQPGAESDDIINFLESNNKKYLLGCALIGLNTYKS